MIIKFEVAEDSTEQVVEVLVISKSELLALSEISSWRPLKYGAVSQKFRPM
jgi:hypothetical protein